MSVDSIMNWVFNWIGHTGLDISILIVLILMCRRPFVKMFGARAAYALWTLPLLRLVLPEIPITLPRPSWMQTVPNAPTEIITYMNVETVIAAPVATPFNWQYPVVAIWLGVAVIWFAAQLVRQHKYIKNIKADAAPVPSNVHDKLNQACKSLGLATVPKICISSFNVGPMVAGIFSPIIVLPQNFEQDYNAGQQVFTLTHELAHIKRGDLWAAFGALVFRAFNWPNPLVHYCTVKFRTDQEAACDAYVLNMIGGGSQTKQSYAATLIHSAKLSTLSTTNSTRNLSNQSVLANPLCLTIYHPLKERLMTLKTSKNNSTILSRIGVGAFLVAALAATAPITIASAADGPAAETPKVKTQTKKVMKWVDKNDGEETTKHIEVIVKDGVTTAYSIDKDGNKTEIDASEVEMMDDLEGLEDLEGLAGMRVFVTDGMPHEKRIKIMKGKHMDGMKGEHRIIIEGLEGLEGLEGFEGLEGLEGLKKLEVLKVLKGMDGNYAWNTDGDEHSKIIIKRLAGGKDGTVVDIDSDFMFVGGEGNHAAAMVGAAQGLLEQAEAMTGDKELSSKTRKKLDKARKALKEAQEALEAEE